MQLTPSISKHPFITNNKQIQRPNRPSRPPSSSSFLSQPSSSTIRQVSFESCNLRSDLKLPESETITFDSGLSNLFTLALIYIFIFYYNPVMVRNHAFYLRFWFWGSAGPSGLFAGVKRHSDAPFTFEREFFNNTNNPAFPITRETFRTDLKEILNGSGENGTAFGNLDRADKHI